MQDLTPFVTLARRIRQCHNIGIEVCAGFRDASRPSNDLGVGYRSRDIKPMIRLAHEQIMELLDADWLGTGPVGLNKTLSLSDLSGCLVVDNARIVMARMDADNGINLTTTGNFNRRFVERMVEEFRWPGYEPEAVWRFNKVLNEPDFVPLHFLHALLDMAGLGRRYKGTFRLGRLGRSLLTPDAAGELNAILFDAAFHRYNLAYLDPSPVTESFQPQISLTLFMLSRVADVPRSATDLLEITTLPIDPPRSDFPFRPDSVFRFRVLRYLEWFGLLNTQRRAANNEFGDHDLYRKTPLFDRFLSFDVAPYIKR